MKKEYRLIGVFGARTFEENNLLFLQELQEQSRQRNYRIIIFSLDTCLEEETEALPVDKEISKMVQYVPVDAFIILGESIKNYELMEEIAALAYKKKVPCFSVDRRLEGCYCLFHDEESGFEPMVRHVIQEHGARRINMLAGFKENLYSNMRIKQYKKVLEEYGIPYEEERVGYGDFWDRPARREVERFLASDLPMPDAIVCANDAMALITCSILEEAGYRVPEDVIVTGYDGVQEGKFYSPVLSTCAPDNKGGIAFVFQEIEKFLKSGIISPDSYLMKYQPEFNQSCGCHGKEQKYHNKVVSELNADLGDCGWHTLAMNDMISSALPLQSVRDIAKNLPNTEYMWCDHLRYACVKENVLYGKDDGAFRNMETILWGNQEKFDTPGNTFAITDWFEQLRVSPHEYETLFIRALHIRGKAYGYTVEAFMNIRKRDMQRCNEFVMFLSNSINMVLQNQQLNLLKEHLLQANHELAMLSEQDAMTDILNRRGFYIRFNEMLQQTKKKYLALLSIDMNRLKYINDTYGHAEGDFAICALAKAVKKLCTQDGICARFGGDEFDCVVFTDDVTTITEESVREKLQKNIDETKGLSQKPYCITASVGLVIEEITDTLSIEEVIKKADSLMYQNKKERRR